MDAYVLYEKGIITLRRTKVRDYLGRIYKIIRFDKHREILCMFVEFPDGSHEPLNQNDIRNMRLELVPDSGFSVSEWIDPA